MQMVFLNFAVFEKRWNIAEAVFALKVGFEDDIFGVAFNHWIIMDLSQDALTS